MDDRNDIDRADEVMLPGFRFHPTDEELVGFYLKRKIQQKPLPIELIRQLDIYKYDPWDLPKMATTGEKEWYFYCPRDRKYRNSARPNRVTGAGFWKATGTDRPIYSSEGTKCIGLKKSLVFYKGRAAKGVKTDWMMHEFRLPSLSDPSLSKRPLDKNIPPNDAWAICRIFKKTNSMAQRALSHSWMSPILPMVSDSGIYSSGTENLSCTTDMLHPHPLQHHQQQIPQTTAIAYPSLDVTAFKPLNLMNSNTKPSPLGLISSSSNDQLPPSGLMYSPELIVLGDTTDKASLSIDFGQPQHCNSFNMDMPLDIGESFISGDDDLSKKMMSVLHESTGNQWGTVKGINFPFNLPMVSDMSDEWKPSLPWESPTCPSEMSATYCTNK